MKKGLCWHRGGLLDFTLLMKWPRLGASCSQFSDPPFLLRRDLPADPRQTDGQRAGRHLLPPVLALRGQLQRGAGGVSDDEEGF